MSAENKNSSESNLTPKWAEDFPVDSDKDIKVARRDFIRFLFLVSVGLFTGTFWVYIKQFFKKQTPTGPFKIISPSDIEVGGSYVFQLPDEKGPAILVRLNETEYFAYSQKCTHLQCPVIWRREESKLICPCHHGAFNVKTGDVLYGPPERALPKINLDVRPEGVYFKNIELFQ